MWTLDSPEIERQVMEVAYNGNTSPWLTVAGFIIIGLNLAAIVMAGVFVFKLLRRKLFRHKTV